MVMGVEEIREEDRAEEKADSWLPVNGGLFRRPVATESAKETLDALGLECGWICLMDGGRLDTGVAKGSLLAAVAVVSGVLERTRVSPVFERRTGIGMLSSVG